MSAPALIPTVAVEEDFRTRAHTALGDQARCEWHSAPGQGTRVALHLPSFPT